MEKQGDVLAFEQVRLLSDRTAFLKTASELLGFESEVTQDKACTEQFTLPVPDMDEKQIVERPGTGHRLSNCLLHASEGAQSSKILEIRAEFIDDRLSRASFRFRAAERAQLLAMLRQRFGAGDDIVLTAQEILDAEQTKVHYWRDGDELWLLHEPEADAVLLVRQDLKSGLSLPEPKRPSKRGEPVSLDDIGIGKLDLKAPLPSMELPATETDAEPATTD